MSPREILATKGGPALARPAFRQWSNPCQAGPAGDGIRRDRFPERRTDRREAKESQGVAFAVFKRTNVVVSEGATGPPLVVTLLPATAGGVVSRFLDSTWVVCGQAWVPVGGRACRRARPRDGRSLVKGGSSQINEKALSGGWRDRRTNGATLC